MLRLRPVWLLLTFPREPVDWLRPLPSVPRLELQLTSVPDVLLLHAEASVTISADRRCRLRSAGGAAPPLLVRRLFTVRQDFTADLTLDALLCAPASLLICFNGM